MRSQVLNLKSVQPESYLREQCCSKRGPLPVREPSVPCPREDQEGERLSKPSWQLDLAVISLPVIIVLVCNIVKSKKTQNWLFTKIV